jgi:flagellar basal-body rod modification protein FlgD
MQATSGPQYTQTPQQNSAPQTTQKKDNGAASAVDFQNFLTLLTAQLRNQDPLNPADSTEFVAQLAQFTSVEQLVNANNKLDNIASVLVAEGIEKYSGWIGKKAETVGAVGYFDGSQPVEYRLSGLSEARKVETVITNSTGKEVARFASLNNASVQSWDGLIDGKPATAGAYAITAIYYDKNNTPIGEEIANVFGQVNAVRLDGEDPEIILNGGVRLDPEQITGIGFAE